MRRVILSSCAGHQWDEISAITWPRMQAFARKHGHDFRSSGLPAGINRSASWLKLVRIAEALADFEEVLWLDADVVVIDDSADMIVPPEFSQAVVQHVFSEGSVPNAGVWLVRRRMLGVLIEIAMSDKHVSHRWWEQAALIEKMGYTPDSAYCHQHARTELADATFLLNEEWNCWVGSQRHVRPRFMHACGLTGTQRLDAIKGWAA